VVRIGDQNFLLLWLREGVLLRVPLERDGSFGTPQRLEDWPTSYFEVSDHDGRAELVWTESGPGVDSVVFATTVDWSTGIGESPREHYRAESAWGIGPFIANGVAWTEVTTFTSSRLIDLSGNAPPFTFMTGLNLGSRWHPTESEVLAITGEPEAPYTSSANLVFRRIDLRTQTVLERTQVVDSPCPIESFNTAMNGALGLIWVDYCEGRSLRARVRRPR
jgi:hypothetical protein